MAGIYVVETDGSKYAGWYAIPYPHRNGIWKTRFRNPDLDTNRYKYMDPEKAEFHLYNPGLLGANPATVVFAEGEFDTLALWDAGFPAIGIHGAKFIGEDGGGKFRREWAYLFEGTQVLVMFDNDEEGKKAAVRLANGLRAFGVDAEVFDWEDLPYGDVSDWWRDDPEGLVGTLQEEVGT